MRQPGGVSGSAYSRTLSRSMASTASRTDPGRSSASVVGERSGAL
ncbi:hypothetical protein [Mycobacterium hubeiense]|nr:hypothetical protein [Mycobacterium sp. QGD 101]